MNEDRRDMAYNLWLVPSPFMFQQPTSFPPNSTQAAPIIFNNEHHAQLPANNHTQFPPFINNLGSSPPNNFKQRKIKPRIKTVSPFENGANPSRQFDEDRSPENHLTVGNIKSENVGDENNSQQIASPPVPMGSVQFDRPEIAEISRTVCNTCGKWFRSRQQLTQHMLVHTDVRKYQCNFCGRAFKQPSHLQQHHRIHTGEKPYRCPLAGCSRAFPQLSNLNHHLRNHDKPDPPSKNTCQYCDRTYASEAVLKNHVLKIHMCKTNSPTQKDISNSSNETQSPVTDNHVGPLATPENDTVLNVTDLAKLKDTGLVPIKCASPQQLDHGYSPNSITRELNSDTVKVENKEEDNFLTDEIIKAYNTIALERFRHSMARLNDRGEEMFDTMENGFRKDSMPVLNTYEMRHNSVQPGPVNDKSEIPTGTNLEHRAKSFNKVEEADMVSFNDKSAMLLEYWKDVNTRPTNSTTVSQHPTVSELLRHKEYVSKFIEDSNFKYQDQERQDDNRQDGTVPLTNQTEIEHESNNANESLVTAETRSNYNYTLDFLEQDMQDLEKRAVSETAPNGSAEPEYNEAHTRHMASPGVQVQMERRSVIEEFVNQTGLAQARPFVQHMFSRLPHEVCSQLGGIGDNMLNNVTHDGTRFPDWCIPPNAYKYARNAFNLEMGAIQSSLARDGPVRNDYSKCADERNGRLSNSRKRKAFQPQRVVYDEEMTGF